MARTVIDQSAAAARAGRNPTPPAGSSLRSSTPSAASRVSVLATVFRAIPVRSAISRAVAPWPLADGGEDRLAVRTPACAAAAGWSCPGARTGSPSSAVGRRRPCALASSAASARSSCCDSS